MVDACIRFKTYDVDITGETPWVRTLTAGFVLFAGVLQQPQLRSLTPPFTPRASLLKKGKETVEVMSDCTDTLSH